MRRNLVRTIMIALVVGSALVLINHGDHLASEPICEHFEHFYVKTALSYATPAVVSIVTTHLATRDKENRA